MREIVKWFHWGFGLSMLSREEVEDAYVGDLEP